MKELFQFFVTLVYHSEVQRKNNITKRLEDFLLMCFFMRYGSQKSHPKAAIEEFIEQK